MIIKIIKVGNPSAWYRDEIGKLCDVVELDNIYYLVSGSDFHIIKKSDCEIIIDENVKWLYV